MGEFSLTAVVRPFGVTTGDPPIRGPIISSPPPHTSEQEDKGLVVIKGSNASFITLNHQSDSTISRQQQKETKRTYDEVRVHNPDDPSQHVDVQRPRKITTAPEKVGVPGGGTSITTTYAPQPAQPNVEVLTEGNVQTNPEYSPSGGSSGGAAP